ncbi:hypothetical protein [Lysobacter sp. N42]|uniref:hypothetical protein n=1 Tax=Lysobacter sp. N42 TaxID=2545719 RepID=UPI00104F7EB8|nr:hypothetical protein [Lysobacter sp. N42]TCZ76713.1 hypothetical protein EYQ95_26190 [Lysobacter sp. N42]
MWINESCCFLEIMLVLLYILNMFCLDSCHVLSIDYFRFQLIYIMSKLITCQTVVSDPFLWYSGPAPVIAFEEEPEGAVDEPQRLVEWQADDVM